MDLDESSRNLLSNMTALVEELTENELHNADPLSVARTLIGVFDGIHPSTYRTQRLSNATKKIRTINGTMIPITLVAIASELVIDNKKVFLYDGVFRKLIA